MLARIKNHGNKIFLQNGIWLETGAEARIPVWEAKLLAMTNSKIEILETTKRKK